MGDYTIEFGTMAAADPAPLLRGLPDDRCQCPHWGFLFRGRLTVRYADGEETFSSGEAYYMAPGHRPRFDEDCEWVEFSPTALWRETRALILRNRELLELSP